jgi:hypothetical protein
MDRPVEKRQASHPLPQAAFEAASLLCQPYQERGLDDGSDRALLKSVAYHVNRLTQIKPPAASRMITSL